VRAEVRWIDTTVPLCCNFVRCEQNGIEIRKKFTLVRGTFLYVCGDLVKGVHLKLVLSRSAWPFFTSRNLKNSSVRRWRLSISEPLAEFSCDNKFF
jgi:hypothetical protein